jgi:hypothetical protein
MNVLELLEEYNYYFILENTHYSCLFLAFNTMQTETITDGYLTSILPTLTDDVIMENYKKRNPNGIPMQVLPLYSSNGNPLTHQDVLSIMDRELSNSLRQSFLLVFLKPSNSQVGHFVLASQHGEKHYIWWDSLNLKDDVLRSYFGIPADEMFGGGLFKRPYVPLLSNGVYAEPRWSTCGYWVTVWANILNSDESERFNKEFLLKPIKRAGGAFTLKTLQNPQSDTNGTGIDTLRKLISLNKSMLDYYHTVI